MIPTWQQKVGDLICSAAVSLLKQLCTKRRIPQFFLILFFKYLLLWNHLTLRVRVVLWNQWSWAGTSGDRITLLGFFSLLLIFQWQELLGLAFKKNQNPCHIWIQNVSFWLRCFFVLRCYSCLPVFFVVIVTTLTDARLHIYIGDQAANSFFPREAERSCKTGDHMLTGCMI